MKGAALWARPCIRGRTGILELKPKVSECAETRARVTQSEQTEGVDRAAAAKRRVWWYLVGSLNQHTPNEEVA